MGRPQPSVRERVLSNKQEWVGGKTQPNGQFASNHPPFLPSPPPCMARIADAPQRSTVSCTHGCFPSHYVPPRGIGHTVVSSKEQPATTPGTQSTITASAMASCSRRLQTFVYTYTYTHNHVAHVGVRGSNLQCDKHVSAVD